MITPIVGMRAFCCAREANGHAATLPISPGSSRRFIQIPTMFRQAILARWYYPHIADQNAMSTQSAIEGTLSSSAAKVKLPRRMADSNATKAFRGGMARMEEFFYLMEEN